MKQSGEWLIVSCAWIDVSLQRQERGRFVGVREAVMVLLGSGEPCPMAEKRFRFKGFTRQERNAIQKALNPSPKLPELLAISEVSPDIPIHTSTSR